MRSTPHAPPSDQPRSPFVVRVLLLAAGSAALGLGVLGAFLPLIPTTPFVLLAAGCYSRASPPAHRWLCRNRFFGPICSSGAEGRYLPLRAKAVAVGLTLASFAATIVFAVEAWPLRAALAGVGVVVTVWLVRLPTEPRLVAARVRDDGPGPAAGRDRDALG